MVEDDPAIVVDRQVHAPRDLVPPVRIGPLQATGEGRRLLQKPGRPHVDVGVVVDGIRLLSDADDLLDFISALALDGAADDPIGDPLQHRPGRLAQIVLIARGVDVLREGVRHAETDVLFEHQMRRGESDRLFAVSRPTCPRKLESAVSVHGGVTFGRLQSLHPVFEQRVRGFGRGQQQRGKGEGFDVPHDMAAVIVVIRPVRQPEHRGAEEGRGVR